MNILRAMVSSVWQTLLPLFMALADQGQAPWEVCGVLDEEAVAFGTPWMLARWGRAKYFHVRDQDCQGLEADLRWILA